MDHALAMRVIQGVSDLLVLPAGATRRGVRYAERSLEIRRELDDIWGQGQSLNFTGVVVGDYEGASPNLRGFYLQDAGYPIFVDWLVQTSSVTREAYRNVRKLGIGASAAA